MAKATDADIEEAMDFCNAMSAITQNWSPTMPEGIGDDEGEYFDIENDRHCGRVLRHLVGLVNNASLVRVVFGCAVMLDPRNKLVDPAADTIEHHPDTVAALEAMSKSTAKATETDEQRKG